MNLDKLRKLYNSSKAQEAERAAEIQRQEANLAALKEQQERAAEAGDLATYDQKTEEIKQATGRLYVTIKAADAARKISPEDAAQTWAEYCADFGRNQKKKLEEYDKDVHALAVKYEGLVSGQNEALKAREEIAEMTGIDPFTGNGQNEISRLYDLPVWLPDKGPRSFPSGSRVEAPEGAFFVGSGEWPESYESGLQNYPALETLNSVVRNHRSVDSVDFGH